jgi:hypothetical protein
MTRKRNKGIESKETIDVQEAHKNMVRIVAK